ncbi:hypothetical protein QT970_19920 [Microcoleus sp. herbarium8]|uniref:hypothetical protein n=1 Tax=Microcoleus sp. herbarium8 TaxID=3055436 RepID=UPI002FD4C81C
MPINLKSLRARRFAPRVQISVFESIALQNHLLPECQKYQADSVFIGRRCLDKTPAES